MPRSKPRHIGAVLRLCVVVVVPLTSALFKRRWHHLDRIPASGPVIVVVNHVSYADPFVMARFIWDSGRLPSFLGKAPLFRIPVIGRLLYAADQIPVDRGTQDAALSLQAAVQALQRDKVVVIYPEGTVTRDPDFWPKEGKTGAARLALMVPDVPVIAVGQWGAQNCVDYYHRRYRPLPRTTVTVSVGARVDLSRFTGSTPSTAILREMTRTIMAAITDEVSAIRETAAPAR